MAFGYQVLGFGSGVAAVPLTVDILVVAGGGNGGKGYGGGGGGGGVVYKTTHTLAAGTQYDVVVGAGGAATSGAPVHGPSMEAQLNLLLKEAVMVPATVEMVVMEVLAEAVLLVLVQEEAQHKVLNQEKVEHTDLDMMAE